jgi:DNA-directed RNA polymerase subunit M/transcription elongation factor TFIIS
MKLINARLCLDCNEVFDPKESIVRDKYSCPKCANKSTVCLTSFFREEKKKDRRPEREEVKGSD